MTYLPDDVDQKPRVRYKAQSLFNNLIWLDAKEASDYLRITVNSLRTKICRGEIPYYKLGRSLRFKKSELDELLESSKQTGGFYGN